MFWRWPKWYRYQIYADHDIRVPMINWCEETFGSSGTSWQRRVIVSKFGPSYCRFEFKFRNKSDYEFFLLRWGTQCMS